MLSKRARGAGRNKVIYDLIPAIFQYVFENNLKWLVHYLDIAVLIL